MAIVNYSYHKAVYDDIADYVTSNIDIFSFKTRDSLFEYLFHDNTFLNAVTGIIEGSYTHDIDVAEENLCFNWDLMNEACDTLGAPRKPYLYSAEGIDASIRYYLLPQILNKFLDNKGYTEEFFDKARSSIINSPYFSTGVIFYTNKVQDVIKSHPDFDEEIFLALNRYCLKEAFDDSLDDHIKSDKTITIYPYGFSDICRTSYGKICIVTDFEEEYTYVKFEGEF